MSVFQAVVLLSAAVLAPLVVATREPRYQVVALSVYGMLLSVLFLTFRAPDVALSQLAVGVVIVPLIMMLALAKVRELELESEDREEQ